MPKMMPSRGPERLIFNTAHVINMETISEIPPPQDGLDAPWKTTGIPLSRRCTISFIPGEDALIRESMNENDVRDRTDRDISIGSYNGDAVFWMQKFDALQKAHSMQMLRLSAVIGQQRREYEASKQLWRKKYTEQGAEEDDDEW